MRSEIKFYCHDLLGSCPILTSPLVMIHDKAFSSSSSSADDDPFWMDWQIVLDIKCAGKLNRSGGQYWWVQSLEGHFKRHGITLSPFTLPDKSSLELCSFVPLTDCAFFANCGITGGVLQPKTLVRLWWWWWFAVVTLWGLGQAKNRRRRGYSATMTKCS